MTHLPRIAHAINNPVIKATTVSYLMFFFPNGTVSFVVPAQPNCCGIATFGIATDVNTAGHIVGGSFSTEPDATIGWIYSAGTNTAIGTLPGGKASIARALNDNDEVVGMATVTPTMSRYCSRPPNSRKPVARDLRF
ncbi:MAG: hypothetical protein ACXVAR_13105 [Vulcanimicrobiaceae bacterium]